MIKNIDVITMVFNKSNITLTTGKIETAVHA